MYAIIKTGGKQYWVVPGEILQVEKINAKVGEDIEFKALWSTGENAKISNNAKVIATVLRHLKGDKIIVFKKKTKKAYEKAKGHRQQLTEIKIKDIILG
jgi:large subunit ribosomal protein L21